MKQPSFCFFLFSIISIHNIFSQPSAADSSLYKAAVNHVAQLYTDSLKENLRLYNGTEFTAAFKTSYGHPFFENAEPQNGEIFYEDVFYDNVRLHYDLIHDEVIFVTPGNNLNIKLITQKIGWFMLPGHLFVNVTSGDTIVGLPADGFYEVVDKDPYSVLIKRKKQLYQPSAAEESSRFILLNDYYLKKDSICYHVKSKRSLLAFCRDRKSQVARFLHEQNLDFKRDPENTILKTLDFYSKLEN